MTVNIITENEDIVKSVNLLVSPAEYLVIGSALKYFVEYSNYHGKDIELAKQMRKALTQRKVEDGNDDTTS